MKVYRQKESYLSLRNSEVKENLDVGVNISRNSYLDLMASSISSNQNSGIRVSKQSIIDFGGNDNDDPIIISNNTNVGLDVYGGVYIEFDDVNVEFQGNNGSINLGNGTHMNVGNSNLTVDQEINCWSLFSKDPNDETITQESEKPIIEFNYTTDLPQVTSNCRIKTSEN